MREWSSLQAWIDAVACASPDKPALMSTDETLSYGEMRRLALGLSRRLLRHANVCADALVAIYTEHSVDMILSVVGILFSGAAYVPLNHKLKILELKSHAAVAKPVAAVATRALMDGLAGIVGGATPCEHVRCECDILDHLVDDLPLPGAREHAAYALFTSGSTGDPKCVAT